MARIIRQGLKGLSLFVSAMMLYACNGKTPQQDLSNISNPMDTIHESKPLVSSDQIQQPILSGSTEEDLEERLKFPSFNWSLDDNTCDEEKIKIKDVFVISDVNGGVASSFAKTPTIDDKVNLFLVLKSVQNGAPVYFSEAENLMIDGKRIPKSQIKKWDPAKYGDLSIIWSKVEPNEGDLSNTEGGWHWEKIRYAEVKFSEGQWKVKPDINPTYFPSSDGLGTMRFKVTVGCGEAVHSSPGKGSMKKTGIKEDVHRISVRGNTGNKIIDWAYSFMNLPYIWGSASPTRRDNDHQTETYQGGDCADFVIAALRKAGMDIGYGGSGDLSPGRGKTRYIVKNPELGGDGTYHIDGEKVRVGKYGVKPGDIVITKGHVGIFSQDLPPTGYLSHDDLMIHTLWGPVKEEAIDGVMRSNEFSIVRPK